MRIKTLPGLSLVALALTGCGSTNTLPGGTHVTLLIAARQSVPELGSVTGSQSNIFSGAGAVKPVVSRRGK